MADFTGFTSDDFYAGLQNNRNIASGNNKTQLQIAKGGWQVSREGIKAQLKAANMQLKFNMEQMKRVGIPEMEANKWYQQQQVRLADQAHELAKSNLGLEYLKFASTLSGPENYFQSANFARGANQQGASAFLTALRNNSGISAFQGQGQGGPAALTADSLFNKLSGGQQASGQNDAQNLQMAQDIFSRGPGSLTPGSLQSLDDSELKLLGSAGGQLGYDVPQWLRSYQRGQIGTESGTAL